MLPTIKILICSRFIFVLISFLPVCGFEINAFENHHESSVVNFEAIASDGWREAECSFGEKLVPEHKTISIPEQDFQSIASSISKYKELATHRIFVHE